MAVEPPATGRKGRKSRRKLSLKGKEKSKSRRSALISETTGHKSVSFSRMIAKVGSKIGAAADPSGHRPNDASTTSKRSSAEHLAALKKSRRLSRKKQLLQEAPQQKHKQRDPSEHHEHTNHEEQERSAQPDPPVPKATSILPPRTLPMGSVGGGDDDTLRTNRTIGTLNTINTLNTLNTLNTMNSTQLSVVSAQYSVVSAWDVGSTATCGMGMFNPFFIPRAANLHDRIRHQMELACAEGYKKGTRLSHLATSQKKFHGDIDIDSSNCGRHVPVSLYGTLKAMKERFRSEAVAETWQEDKEPLSVKLQKKIPTKEELEQYASQSKQKLLETIEALEKVRTRVDQTLGPTIEKLREHTEKACIQSDAWCRENYTCLVATSTQLHEQLATKTGDYLNGTKLQDPPEVDADDISIMEDEIGATPTGSELYGESDQVILKRLKNAVSSFLEHYGALLWSLHPAGPKTETEVVLELPDDFGHDSKKLNPSLQIHKVKVLKDGDEEEEEHNDVQDSQDSEDLQEPERSDESEEEAPESEDTGMGPETTEDQEPITEDHEPKPEEQAEVSENQKEQVVTNSDLNDAPKDPHKRGVDPEEGNPREPDGVKPSDDNSVEESTSSKRKKEEGKSDASKQSARSSKKDLKISTSGDSLSGELRRVEGNPSLGEASAQFPINLVGSRDSQGSTGRYYDKNEAARLEKASASVWKKLRKLTKKKKMFAVSMFGDMVNEIAKEEVDIPSLAVGDDSSLLTNGTEENPIVLLEEDIVERPTVDKSTSRKRRALSEDRDAERLKELEDQSLVSGLTATTGMETAATTIASGSQGKSEIKEDLQEFVVEYLGSHDQRDDENATRLEAAEHLLTSLKAHMNERKESKLNVFMTMEESETSELTRDVEGNPRILPASMRGYPKPESPRYNRARHHRPPLHRREPEIIRVISEEEPDIIHPPTINLVTTNSDLQPPETDSLPISRSRSSLMADPNRHAILKEDEREQIASSHLLKPPRPVLSNPSLLSSNPSLQEPDVIFDLTSVSADSNGNLNLRSEQRDDHPIRRRYDPPPQPQDDSTAFLYHDPRYFGDVDDESRPAINEVRKPPSFNSLSSDMSEGKSVTSSILGKRIPGRSKSVSFNLPDEDEDGGVETTTTVRTKKSFSVRSRSTSINTTAAVASQSYDERAAAARRELARLSQRQATLVARGAQMRK